MNRSRYIRPVITPKVAYSGLTITAMNHIVACTLKRWLQDEDDYLSSFQPIGIHVEVSDGDKIIDTRLITEFPGLKEKMYCVIDEAESGVLVTILLPEEY